MVGDIVFDLTAEDAEDAEERSEHCEDDVEVDQRSEWCHGVCCSLLASRDSLRLRPGCGSSPPAGQNIPEELSCTHAVHVYTTLTVHCTHTLHCWCTLEIISIVKRIKNQSHQLYPYYLFLEGFGLIKNSLCLQTEPQSYLLK